MEPAQGPAQRAGSTEPAAAASKLGEEILPQVQQLCWAQTAALPRSTSKSRAQPHCVTSFPHPFWPCSCCSLGSLPCSLPRPGSGHHGRRAGSPGCGSASLRVSAGWRNPCRTLSCLSYFLWPENSRSGGGVEEGCWEPAGWGGNFQETMVEGGEAGAGSQLGDPWLALARREKEQERAVKPGGNSEGEWGSQSARVQEDKAEEGDSESPPKCSEPRGSARPRDGLVDFPGKPGAPWAVGMRPPPSYHRGVAVCSH